MQSVVAGIIEHEGKILIAQRPEGKHLAGLWEFPGGKLEAGETLFQALQRELSEELGIQILNTEFIAQVEYKDEEYCLTLNILKVLAFQGTAYGKEGQIIRWIDKCDLKNYQFPPANTEMIKKILTQIPE